MLAIDTLSDIARRYPRTYDAFTHMPGGAEALAHVAALDRRWAELARGERPTGRVHTGELPQAERDFDVIVAGGSLGLLTALALRRQGWQVMVFDQRRAGSAHREWNISQAELNALAEAGLFTREELDSVVMRRYRTGLVQFAGGRRPSHTLWIDDVLDQAVDAGALLRLARAKLEAEGVTILDGREFRQVWLAPAGEPARCVVEVGRADGATERYAARLLVNGMGATSPLSLALVAQPFSAVCPTVGTVAAGFATEGPKAVDLNVGEILVTVDHAMGHRQLMWEGFPGRDDELTVYLFYYDLVDPEHPQSLLELFEVYFARLPEYKAPGPDFEHRRPVYGFIPARHRLDNTAPQARGVLAIGDASAQQSPLTFCGFGSHVRNLARVADLADYALRHDLLEAGSLAQVTAHQANVSLMWVFARFMQPWRGGSEVNDLMNTFMAFLESFGPEAVRRFFQDRTTWWDYVRLLLRFGLRQPKIFVWTYQALGWRGIRQWTVDLVRFTGARLGLWLFTRLGATGQAVLTHAAARVRPGWGLRLRAMRTEWEVSRAG